MHAMLSSGIIESKNHVIMLFIYLNFPTGWRFGPATTKTDLGARVLQPWHPMRSLCCKPSLRPDSNIKELSKDVALITNNKSTKAKRVELKHVAARKLSFWISQLSCISFMGTLQNGHWRSGEAYQPRWFLHFKWPSEDNMTTSQNSWSLRKTSSPWRRGALQRET